MAVIGELDSVDGLAPSGCDHRADVPLRERGVHPASDYAAALAQVYQVSPQRVAAIAARVQHHMDSATDQSGCFGFDLPTNMLDIVAPEHLRESNWQRLIVLGHDLHTEHRIPRVP